tara:strand:+ start:19378 stop:19668 length:291 start_codon:yes stop_codon:yes gene_type:complete
MQDSLGTERIHDPWIAYDKVLHLGISFSLVLSTQYILENKLDLRKNSALPAGIVVSATNGIVKELWDKKIGSYISRRDLIADALGIFLGCLVVIID